MSEPLPCFICGAPTHLLFQREGFFIRACSGCGLEFIHPQPDDRQLGEIYGERYYDSWGGGIANAQVRRMKQATFGRYISRLSPNHHRDGPARLLDCGAATGYLVDLAHTLGWEAFAVELSTFGAEACAQILGNEHVFEGQVTDASFGANPGGLFEAITLFDFIEHVRDPRTVLRWVKDHLSPGGELLIVTPNVGGLLHRIMGRDWIHYKLEHLSYFTDVAISQLLADIGLTVTEIRMAQKAVTLDYGFHQLQAYQHPLLTPIAKWSQQIVPARWRNTLLWLPLGEMEVMAHA